MKTQLVPAVLPTARRRASRDAKQEPQRVYWDHRGGADVEGIDDLGPPKMASAGGRVCHRRAATASAHSPSSAQPASTAAWPAAAPSKSAVLRSRFPPAPGGIS